MLFTLVYALLAGRLTLRPGVALRIAHQAFAATVDTAFAGEAVCSLSRTLDLFVGAYKPEGNVQGVGSRSKARPLGQAGDEGQDGSYAAGRAEQGALTEEVVAAGLLQSGSSPNIVGLLPLGDLLVVRHAAKCARSSKEPRILRKK